MVASWTRIAAAMIAALALVYGNAGAGDAPCGPYGDQPAEIQTGFFAGLVTKHTPDCFRGKLLGPWRDSDGTDHYSCVYEPSSIEDGNPLPLVVFLHGSLADADLVILTNLSASLETADLGGGHKGFILLSPEGRDTTHYYIGPDRTGLGWDNWYRQFNPSGDTTVSGVKYRENVDAAAIDYFIEQEVATGRVDRKRIYMTGWSNGAAMALTYALNRPMIAAAAIYSAPDPFGAFGDPCRQTPVTHPAANNGEIQLTNSHVPVMHVRNSCDIGGICPNGNTLSRQLRSIGIEFDDVIIDASSNRVETCDDSCGTDPDAGINIFSIGSIRGLKNHIVWPNDWTARMLEFLRNHPSQ
ncbi:MAG TPA: PHB depolymerase family esterase [Candidatus Binataceae bacterium]|nr:PHB depolymerase family esterase [Candidatus Binataceae bacterium]